MPLLRLKQSDVDELADTSESAMGVHVVRTERGDGVVLSGLVLLLPDKEAWRQTSELLKKSWFRESADEPSTKSDFEKWLRSLSPAPAVTSAGSGRVPHTGATGGVTPTGSLPLTKRTRSGDVFYRCEHWPTSKRINPTTGVVAKGTYAFPLLEKEFVRSGFAAVGRFALPSVLPACRRYKLKPPASTTYRCGACVPLFGQAGGGVEVEFPRSFKNAGKIHAPRLLPEL